MNLAGGRAIINGGESTEPVFVLDTVVIVSRLLSGLELVFLYVEVVLRIN